MLTRSYFTSDEAYDAYLLECDVLIKYRKEARSVPALRTSLRMEEKVREDYVGIVLSLQEKINELQAKIEKLENDYTSVVCCWQEETEESVALKKKNDKLQNILRYKDQVITTLSETIEDFNNSL